MIKTARQLKDLIRNLSKKNAADAQILMRNYMMERFLERISLSSYRDKFILKGGMLVAAMVGLDARSTMDLDATVKGANVSVEDVENMMAEIKPELVQSKRLWQYIVTRTAKPRIARKLVDGKYVKYMLYPKLGEKARNNGHVVYSLDFEVTPHMLRHTYITNLIHASVDPKTVQYLAGHESSKITMDIYAKVKYNKPEQLAGVLSGAFAEWDGGEYEAAQ